MNNSNNDILHIAYDSIPKVLMLGNGINCAYDFGSWDDLLFSIDSNIMPFRSSSVMISGMVSVSP